MALHIGAAEVGLADADEPFVGRDLEHEFVLGRAAGVRALASRQQHEAPDVGDLHGVILLLGRPGQQGRALPRPIARELVRADR